MRSAINRTCKLLVSVCLCICMHVCAFIRTYMYVCACMHTYTCIRIHACMHAHMHTHTCMYACTHAYTYAADLNDYLFLNEEQQLI